MWPKGGSWTQEVAWWAGRGRELGLSTWGAAPREMGWWGSASSFNYSGLFLVRGVGFCPGFWRNNLGEGRSQIPGGMGDSGGGWLQPLLWLLLCGWTCGLWQQGERVLACLVPYLGLTLQSFLCSFFLFIFWIPTNSLPYPLNNLIAIYAAPHSIPLPFPTVTTILGFGFSIPFHGLFVVYLFTPLFILGLVLFHIYCLCTIMLILACSAFYLMLSSWKLSNTNDPWTTQI